MGTSFRHHYVLYSAARFWGVTWIQSFRHFSFFVSFVDLFLLSLCQTPFSVVC
ncbi:hypothetical protein HanIR_Chr04g0172141 [Helianthus annuus]|nr:hypothetical protein HanIR_Chr04g0172141 [Helianthus annuus]